MGAPGAELPRDTIRHACSVAHSVSLTEPTVTFHPRPIGGLGFYASVCLFRSIPSLGKAKVRSLPLNNEQRSQPRRGEIFVTPWLPPHV